MASIVFGCDDLRREILSYLRKKPFLSCRSCYSMIKWEPWHKGKPEMYGYCSDCLWKGTGPGCDVI